MGRLGIFSSSCGSILARRIPTSAFTSPGHRVHRAHATTTHVPIACEQSGVRSNKMSSTAGSEADPWNRETKQKFEGKDRSEFLDPCQEAAARSIRCLHRNGGDRSLCSDYFQAYRDCKKAWIEKRKARK